MGPHRRDESSDESEGDGDNYDSYGDNYGDNEEYNLEEGRGRGDRVDRGGGEYHGEGKSHESEEEYGEVWDGDLQQLGFGEEDFYGRMTSLLVGRTTGRRIKRVILKYGTLHSLLGFVLVCLSSYEDYNFSFLSVFSAHTHGASIISLMWLVSFPTFLLGLLSLLGVYYWASLCTNREFFTSLLKIYLGWLLFLLAVDVWCVSAVFLTFRHADFKTNIDLAAAQGVYVASMVFMVPFLISLFFHLIDAQFLKDELERGGVLLEPNPPKGTKDLTGMSVAHICGLIWAIPFLIFFQLGDIIGALYRLIERCAASRRRTLLGKDQDKINKKNKKPKGFCHRVYKTVRKLLLFCCGCCFFLGRRIGGKVGDMREKGSMKKVIPLDREDDKDGRDAMLRDQILKDQAKERERGEREGRERETRERVDREERERGERESKRVADEQRSITRQAEMKEHQIKKDEEQVRKDEEQREEQRERDAAEKLLEEEFEEKRRKRREDEELQAEVDAEKKRRKEHRESEALAAAIKEKEAKDAIKKERLKEKDIPFYPILTAPLYKSLWASLGIAGSFQCKLKVAPAVTVLCAHLKKQGFHVIFSTSSGTVGVGAGVECEVGFCNIRAAEKKEGLFMGKFLVVKNDFSASMKSENPSDVPNYVKKFALAKVLKIDVST